MDAVVATKKARGNAASKQTEPAPENFDADLYLRVYPDVALAIEAGTCATALDHYLEHGRKEHRLDDLRYRNALQSADTESFPPSSVDVAFISNSGRALVIGWIRDDDAPLRSVAVLRGAELIGVTTVVARCRREDAEQSWGGATGRLLGFWALLAIEQPTEPSDAVKVRLSAGQQQRTLAVRPEFVGDVRLRELAFEYFAGARYFGNAQVEAFLQLEAGIGAPLMQLGTEVARELTGQAICTRFGPKRSRPVGSIVVCLYGKPEFLFLQAALFADRAGLRDYEFVYVSNSPDLAERLMKEASIASHIYDAAITVVVLPGNAGFGPANNVGVSFARSSRVLIINPDVFPRDPDWGRLHRELIEGLPSEQVALFGVPLYYDDGSLMHAGMWFDCDTGLSIRPHGIEQRDMLRIEHYGKGAPPRTETFLAARPVSAVTGAFISADRAWFESCGGFSAEYIFGHYEDADLCLKSLSGGRPVWLHNLPFWHLEGKGSTRRLAHEGASMLNRWHFTTKWGGLVKSELLGKAPARLASSKRAPQIHAAIR